MDPISRVVAAGAAGAGGAAGAALYVDDVFSTYLYDGNNSTQTITNGIDLSGEGGLVWIKKRESNQHMLYDTERGANIDLNTSDTSGNNTETLALTSFNSNGFSLNSLGDVNQVFFNYASWTFRKAPGFFDVVTYTGNGTTQSISHSLGSTPGWIVVKRTDSTGEWTHLHRNDGTTWRQVAGFNTNALVNANGTVWGSDSSTFVAPTSSSFTVGSYGGVNASGGTYVAYIFAHDDQSFGTNSDEAIIKCGSYAATGSAQTVDLGFEPQFLITKKSSGTGEWRINDMMRGIVTGGADAQLDADSSNAEVTGNVTCDLTPSGFITNGSQNDSGGTYIYIAIRRPHKPPEAGTDVFAAQDGRSASDGSASQSTYTSGFPVDLIMRHTKASDSTRTVVFDRLRGENYLLTHSTAAQASGDFILFDDMDGVYRSSVSANTGLFAHMFKRAPQFMDVVSFLGNNTPRTITHNLEAVPELMIVKDCDRLEEWMVYSATTGANKYLRLNSNDYESNDSQGDMWGGTTPTSSVFSLGNSSNTNHTGSKIIAYLFSSLSGISKVGSYTGTGSGVINVDCGFTAGARFVLIKRTDSTGDWYVWDSTRGIVSGDDPYILLNTTAAQVTNTDYLDPLNAGFTVTSSAPAALNTSGGTYLFLAIA